MSAFQELHTVLNRCAPIDCDIDDLVGRVEQSIRADERSEIMSAIYTLERKPQNPSWWVDLRDAIAMIESRSVARV